MELAPLSGYSPLHDSALEDRFRRIERQYVTVDRRIEDGERYRREVGPNWSMWFHDASRDLRDATRSFDDVTGGRERAVVDDLMSAVGNLDRRSDQLYDMDRRNQSFGRGWGRVLDDPIRAVRDAINILRRSGDGDWRP